jgi:Tol biopolymer transport system component
MKKATLIFSLLIFIFGTLACGSTTPLPAPSPAPVIETTPLPAPDSVSPEPQVTAQVATPQIAIAAPSGLRIVYLREGNLWSWVEAAGAVQLTDTGDISTVRLSDDGQSLAYMRGSEVWLVGMDGQNARLLATQQSAGGALWFAPNGSLLAISTNDHINAINLQDASTTTVMTYPAIQNNYAPQVIWTPDASGFKTVIPPQTGTGQADFLFVFTSGTVASLAKFALVPLSESLPYLSPDGGYIIYAEKLNDRNESLYLMDSSGATRPYGEAAAKVRALGWLPDSQRFAYTFEDTSRTFVGNVNAPPVEIPLEGYQTLRWVDEEHYLGLQDGSLYLGNLNNGKTLIDAQVSGFDFGL